jgi:hypothetical protein
MHWFDAFFGTPNSISPYASWAISMSALRPYCVEKVGPAAPEVNFGQQKFRVSLPLESLLHYEACQSSSVTDQNGWQSFSTQYARILDVARA